MKAGIKHFLFVGIVFAFFVGWVATIAVNTGLGILLESVLAAPPTKFYLASAFLTVVSLGLILACEIAGNRLFRRRFAPEGLQTSSVWISTLLFAALVIAYVAPELSRDLTDIVNNTSYFYRHSSHLLMLLSLPLARVVLLPALHFVVARVTLRRSNSS